MLSCEFCDIIANKSPSFWYVSGNNDKLTLYIVSGFRLIAKLFDGFSSV